MICQLCIHDGAGGMNERDVWCALQRTLRMAGCGVNLRVNISRRETSLVCRIDYTESADKGRGDRARCLQRSDTSYKTEAH